MSFGQGGEKTQQVFQTGQWMGALTVPNLPTMKLKIKGHIVIPYTQGLCESIKKICGRYGIQTHFKGGRTIKNLLVSPKGKDPMVNLSGAIYWYQCGDLGWDDEYIGETYQDLWWKIQKSTQSPPLPFITTATKQATPLTKITSK